MARLIDADALVEKLQKDENINLIADIMISRINNEPTAYDVDKVMSELEEQRMRYFLTIANTGDASLDIAYKEVSGAIEKAIDIVKRGGVE